MSCKITDYFGNLFAKSRQLLGEVRFSVNLSVSREISFRIDAQEVSVEWGDGEVTAGSRVDAFLHRYTKAGVYHGCIRGKNITDLDVPCCYLDVLDVTMCQSLEFLDCSDNKITELDLRNCKELYEVYCAKNQIRELKLSNYEKLFYLSCSYNELESLDLSGCTKLMTFRCRSNRLHKLDLKRCRKLVSVNIEENEFNHQELFEFLATLVKRPVNDKGFLIFHPDENDEGYDRAKFLNYIKKRGWCEI